MDGDVEGDTSMTMQADLLLFADTEAELEERCATARATVPHGTWTSGITYRGVRPNDAVTASVREAFAAAGRGFEANPPKLPFATDFGNISQRGPRRADRRRARRGLGLPHRRGTRAVHLGGRLRRGDRDGTRARAERRTADRAASPDAADVGRREGRTSRLRTGSRPHAPGTCPHAEWVHRPAASRPPALTKERPEVPVLDPIHLDAVDAQGVTPAVAAAGLTRRYGQGATAVDALRGVDLAIDAGEMVAVMGPSGSGKSTLMHLLAGLDRPTERHRHGRRPGHHEAQGRGAHAPSPRSHRLRLPGLQPAPDAHRRGERRPADPPRRAHERRGRRRRIANLIDRVGLAERKRHRPAELSGGQQQRVAVARALVTEPAVVFADEPTGNLDSRSSAEVLGLLRDAASDFGRAVVMVTHDARAAAEADRVLFLADGLVVAERSRLSSAEILDAMKEIAR